MRGEKINKLDPDHFFPASFFNKRDYYVIASLAVMQRY